MRAGSKGLPDPAPLPPVEDEPAAAPEPAVIPEPPPEPLVAAAPPAPPEGSEAFGPSEASSLAHPARSAREEAPTTAWRRGEPRKNLNVTRPTDRKTKLAFGESESNSSERDSTRYVLWIANLRICVRALVQKALNRSRKRRRAPVGSPCTSDRCRAAKSGRAGRQGRGAERWGGGCRCASRA